MSKIFNTYPSSKLERIAVFNELEGKILRELRRAPNGLTVKKLMELTRKGRLTVFYDLRKLEKRGLISCDKTKHAHKWNFFETTQTPLVTDGPKGGGSVATAYQILHNSNQHKIIGIQGNGAVKSIIKNVGMGKNFSKTHTRQKLRQVIIDGILTEESINLIQGLEKKFLKSHFGRPSILHTIPDNPLISNYEIISDGKILVSINHTKNVATISHDLEIVRAYLALHETIKKSGVKRNPTEIYGKVE